MEQFCWICGAKANSREHKIKKKDIVRANGRGPYKDDLELVHYCEGKETIVQGPNAKILKHNVSLCCNCNNTLTQPFDQAYDTFVNWVVENEELVLHKRFIDLVDVFGDEFEAAQRNLYKYYAKSFGCRIVDAGATVPVDVVKLLKKVRC